VKEYNYNKFYVAQLVASGNDHYVFTRWGRVGESGAVQLNGPLDREQGEKEFKKKCLSLFNLKKEYLQNKAKKIFINFMIIAPLKQC
jgi:predicted DNA-binding WGR domain protein